MAVIGNLVADLAANSAAFNRDMDSATRNLRSNTARMNRSLGAIDRQFARVRAGAANMARSVFSIRGAVAALAAAGGVAYAGRQALQAADDMAKLADQTGFTVEQISALQFQASQTGAADVLNSGLRTLAQTMGNLQNDTGRLYSFLQRYDQELMDNLRTVETQEERVRLLADAIRDETDAAQRGALARAAFGGAGAQLVNTFRGGASAIDEFRREAEDLNLVLGDEGARNAEALNDELDRMVRSMRMEWTIAVTNHADEVLALAEAWQGVKLGALDAAAAVGGFLRLGGFGSDRVTPASTPKRAQEQATEARRLSQLVNLVPAAGRSDEVRDFLGRDFMGDAWREALQSAADEGLRGRARNERAMEIQVEAVQVELARLATVLAERVTDLQERRAGRRALDQGDGRDRSAPGSASASPSTLTGLLDQVERDIQARRDERAAAAQSLYEATRTAAESYRLELVRIAELEDAGAFAEAGGADTAARGRVQALVSMAEATGQLGQAMREARALAENGLISEVQLARVGAALDQLDDAPRLMDEIRDAGDNILRGAQSEVLAFAEGFQSMGETVTGVIRSIVRELASLALERLAFAPLRGAMNSFLDNLSFGGVDLGGGVGKKAGSIPKFQRGGSFTVGGAGGVDSQLVMFKATPGEDVDVTPSGAAGRRFAGGGALVVERIVEKVVPIVITEGEMFAARVEEAATPVAAASYERAVEDGANLALSRISKSQRLATR